MAYVLPTLERQRCNRSLSRSSPKSAPAVRDECDQVDAKTQRQPLCAPRGAEEDRDGQRHSETARAQREGAERDKVTGSGVPAPMPKSGPLSLACHTEYPLF